VKKRLSSPRGTVKYIPLKGRTDIGKFGQTSPAKQAAIGNFAHFSQQGNGAGGGGRGGQLAYMPVPVTKNRIVIVGTVLMFLNGFLSSRIGFKNTAGRREENKK
jgi:hypothetical protein